MTLIHGNPVIHTVFGYFSHNSQQPSVLWATTWCVVLRKVTIRGRWIFLAIITGILCTIAPLLCIIHDIDLGSKPTRKLTCIALIIAATFRQAYAYIHADVFVPVSTVYVITGTNHSNLSDWWPSNCEAKLRVFCSCIFFAQKISKIRTSVTNLEGEDNPSPDFLVLYSLDIYGIIIFKNHGMTNWYCFIAVVALFLILNHKFARSLTNEYLGNRSCTWADSSYVFPFHKN